MKNTSLSLVQQFPKDKFNILVPIETVTKISEIQSPVLNTVKLSTDPKDGEIYIQEKSYIDKKGTRTSDKYAIAKNGLTRLAEAAGIKQVSSEPILPSTCQKCVAVNKGIEKPLQCGQCGNQDVKYKVTISVPQLTGEVLYFTDHHEINVKNVVGGMTDKQRIEFMKHLPQICEAKALNGAIRTGLQIKGTYFLEELSKPFVVAYLVPNLDHPDVKRVAINNMFASTMHLFGKQPAIDVEKELEDTKVDMKTGQNDYYEDVLETNTQKESQVVESKETLPMEDRSRDFRCDKCDCVIPEKVWNYSYENMGQPLCYLHQKGVKKL